MTTPLSPYPQPAKTTCQQQQGRLLSVLAIPLSQRFGLYSTLTIFCIDSPAAARGLGAKTGGALPNLRNFGPIHAQISPETAPKHNLYRQATASPLVLGSTHTLPPPPPHNPHPPLRVPRTPPAAAGACHTAAAAPWPRPGLCARGSPTPSLRSDPALGAAHASGPSAGPGSGGPTAARTSAGRRSPASTSGFGCWRTPPPAQRTRQSVGALGSMDAFPKNWGTSGGTIEGEGGGAGVKGRGGGGVKTGGGGHRRKTRETGGNCGTGPAELN